MRFIVSREKLCEAVTNLSRAVATKATFPVLEGIYMSATNEGLKMMAYNLEIGMTKTIDITCAEEGSIVFKAKLLGEILRSMTEENVSFEVNDRFICKINAVLQCLMLWECLLLIFLKCLLLMIAKDLHFLVKI